MDKSQKAFMFFASIIFLLFIVLIARFYFLQVLKHEEGLKDAEGPVRVSVVRGKRGTIYDRNGTPLAVSEQKINIAVDPKGIRDKEFMAKIISDTIGIDRSVVLNILKKPSNFRYLKKDASYDEVAALKNAIKEAAQKEDKLSKNRELPSEETSRAARHVKDLDNIIYEEGYKRVYPQGKLLANVLGFIQANNNPEEEGSEGLEGIEKKYDEYLVGKKREIERSNFKKFDRDMDIDMELESNRGADVYLTIDSEIQFVAEEELTKMVEKVQAKWGGVVIMEPSSGKILAMANYPTYEPEHFGKYPAENKRNYAVSDLFEPGSTFKSFSILAVLNENLVKPGELVFGENGSFVFGKKVIHDSHPNQWMTVRDVIVSSSNIGTIKFADRLTNEQLYNYFSMFGFGQKSGINISGEANRPIRDYKNWYPIDKGNIAFGQGISVNMVQMARAYSAIYNGGVLWEPVLVDKIKGKDVKGKSFEQVFVPKPTRINYKYKSDKKIIDMLEGVVSDDHGTAKKARLRGVEVGGKTGTSQIYDPVAKKFSWNKVVCSFAGAAPNNDPKFVMIVVIDEPKGREFGGSVAAPVFRDIAMRILPKFNVFIDKKDKDKDKDAVADFDTNDVTGSVIDLESSEIESDYVKIPDFVKMGSYDALRIANNKNLDVVFVGNPANNKSVLSQSPNAGESVLSGTMVTLYTEEGKTDEND